MKRAPLLWLASSPSIDDFKVSPAPFCSCLSKSNKFDNCDKAPYTDPFNYYSHKANLNAVLTCNQAELTLPLLPRIPTKHFYNCIFSKSLTCNYANLKDLRNRGTLQDTTIKKRHCIKSPTNETLRTACIFHKQYPICAVNFPNKISRSS